MSTPTFEAKVNDFLAQKRIAVAGVSRDTSGHPSANLIYHRLKNMGHDVFPVNPNMKSFEGAQCFPNVQSIPGGVDGVVIITRPDTTEGVVRDCDAAGIKRVWMHESMANGSSVSSDAVQFCREHNISVIDGGCPMMFGPGIDFGHMCMKWIMNLTGRFPA